MKEIHNMATAAIDSDGDRSTLVLLKGAIDALPAGDDKDNLELLIGLLLSTHPGMVLLNKPWLATYNILLASIAKITA